VIIHLFLQYLRFRTDKPFCCCRFAFAHKEHC